MNRLISLTIFGALVAAGPPSFGADPDAPASPPKPAASPAARPGTGPGAGGAARRPEPPVPPLVYLKTGARLFNERRYDLAGKYLNAAAAYSDRLREPEREVLAVYQDRLARYRRELEEVRNSPSPAPATDAAVMAASTASVVRTERPGERPAGDTLPSLDPAGSLPGLEPSAGGPGVAPAARPGPGPGVIRGTETWRGTMDMKQKARWLLQSAREQVFRGRYDEAERLVDEVKGMDVRWGFFDDTPAKVAETLARARARAAKGAPKGSSPGAADQPHDRRAVKARLREARAALAAGRVDEAERVAQEVKSWGVRYGLFDDTPEKLGADLGEARRREAVQGDGLMVRSSPGTNPAPDQGQPGGSPAPEPSPGPVPPNPR